MQFRRHFARFKVRLHSKIQKPLIDLPERVNAMEGNFRLDAGAAIKRSGDPELFVMLINAKIESKVIEKLDIKTTNLNRLQKIRSNAGYRNNSTELFNRC